MSSPELTSTGDFSRVPPGWEDAGGSGLGGKYQQKPWEFVTWKWGWRIPPPRRERRTGRRGDEQGELGAANPASLTLAAGSVVAWSTLVAVRSLEVGLAHAHPHPGVFATGVAFRPAGVAVAVWSRDKQRATPRAAVSWPVPLGRRPVWTGQELPGEAAAQAFAS